MWNRVESWIVPDADREVVVVTFSAAIQLMCLGLGDATTPNLTTDDLIRIESIAAEVHRWADRTAPPDPHDLADLAHVRLSCIPIGSDLPEAVSATRSLYRSLHGARNRGLAAAFALASSLVARDARPASDIFCWRLAAELLVPAWAVATFGADELTRDHPHAPAWLVSHRRTQLSVASK